MGCTCALLANEDGLGGILSPLLGVVIILLWVHISYHQSHPPMFPDVVDMEFNLSGEVEAILEPYACRVCTTLSPARSPPTHRRSAAAHPTYSWSIMWSGRIVGSYCVWSAAGVRI